MVRILGILVGLGFCGVAAWSLLWGAIAYLGEDRQDTVEARFHALTNCGEVRHTVIRIIGNHLRNDAHASWQGHDLDFTDIVFDGGDLHQAVFNSDHISFRGARFVDGTVDFRDATGQRPAGLPDELAPHLS